MITFFITTSAYAFTFEITTDYLPNDSEVTFDLNLKTDESVTLNLFDFEFGFDSQELSFVSHTFTPPQGLVASSLTGFSADQVNGTLNGFAAEPPGFFDPGAIVNTNFHLGSFTFTVLAGVSDGTTDFNFDYADNQLSYIVNDDFTSFDSSKIISHMTDIGPSAVPIPSALWLMGAGLISLAGLRRK